MTTSIKQRSLGFRERLVTGVTAVALHSFVCFAIFDDISFSYLSIVCTCFVPAERPGLGYFLLFHGLGLPLFSPFFLHSLTPVKRETTIETMPGKVFILFVTFVKQDDILGFEPGLTEEGLVGE